MPQAFDTQNPPFDRLTHAEAAELRARLDIGYWSTGETIVERGKPADQLHVVIKGAVEERSGDDVEAVLGRQGQFRCARAGAWRGRRLRSWLPRKRFAIWSPKPSSSTSSSATPVSPPSSIRSCRANSPATTCVDSQTAASIRCCAPASRMPSATTASFIDGGATIVEASRMMRVPQHRQPVRARWRAHWHHHRHEACQGRRAVCACRWTPRSATWRISTSNPWKRTTFIFEALIKMTRHNKRRLAVTSGGEYVGHAGGHRHPRAGGGQLAAHPGPHRPRPQHRRPGGARPRHPESGGAPASPGREGGGDRRNHLRPQPRADLPSSTT